MISALLCDHESRLWVGTGEGLLCVDGKTQHVYTRDNSGLLSNHIADLATDGCYVYVGTDLGIARYDSSAAGSEGNDTGGIVKVGVGAVRLPRAGGATFTNSLASRKQSMHEATDHTGWF